MKLYESYEQGDVWTYDVKEDDGLEIFYGREFSCTGELAASLKEVDRGDNLEITLNGGKKGDDLRVIKINRSEAAYLTMLLLLLNRGEKMELSLMDEVAKLL